VGVVGKWRNPAAPPGQGIVPDPQNRYEVAVDLARIGELREFLKFTCVHFEQECLYAARRGLLLDADDVIHK
jgi:hypothetical protein